MKITDDQKFIAKAIFQLVFGLVVLASLIFLAYWLFILKGIETNLGLIIITFMGMAFCRTIFYEKPELSTKDKWKHLGYFISSYMLCGLLAASYGAFFLVQFENIYKFFHNKPIPTNDSEYKVFIAGVLATIAYAVINKFYKKSQYAPIAAALFAV